MYIFHLQDQPGHEAGDVFISDYEEGSYDGSGEAILLKDGKVYVYGLGHCSCYGPLENTPTEYTQEEFENLSVLDFDNTKILECYNWFKQWTPHRRKDR